VSSWARPSPPARSRTGLCVEQGRLSAVHATEGQTAATDLSTPTTPRGDPPGSAIYRRRRTSAQTVSGWARCERSSRQPRRHRRVGAFGGRPSARGEREPCRPARPADPGRAAPDERCEGARARALCTAAQRRQRGAYRSAQRRTSTRSITGLTMRRRLAMRLLGSAFELPQVVPFGKNHRRGIELAQQALPPDRPLADPVFIVPAVVV
jgi:hypothetical protein